MAMGTSTGNISIWKVMSKEKMIAGPKHNSEIYDLEFSPDSKWLISAWPQTVPARGALTVDGRQKYSIVHGDWVEDVTFGPGQLMVCHCFR